MNLYRDNFDTVSDFMQYAKTMRKESKGKWYAYIGNVNGNSIELKIYDTWIQVFRNNGIHQSTCIDTTVTEFFNTIQKGL
jgi:hypothetical protein